MKRFIAATLAILFLMGLCACDGDSTNGNPDSSINNTTEAKPVEIDSALVGKWYGPENDPVLDISANGTGSAEYQGKTFTANFFAENGIFTVLSEGYSISGNYELSEEALTVIIDYDGKDYTLVFTRTPIEAPDSSCIYTVGDKNYEIVFSEYKIHEDSFPPKENPPSKKVYFVPEGSTDIWIIYETPPTDYGNNGTNENSDKNSTSDKTSEAATDNKSSTASTKASENIAESVINTTSANSSESATESATKGSDPNSEIPIPQKVDLTTEDPKVTVNNKEAPAFKSSYDITGTWSNTGMDTYVYVFGFEGTYKTPIVYTFNADGTGTVTAMGIFTGSLTYTCNNGVLDLTVTMLGETESGTGFVKRVGDVLYVENLNGDVLALAKSG